MEHLQFYSAIFFDFDGLLVNTEHLHFEAYRKTLAQHGIECPWDFPAFAGVAHKSASGLCKAITAHAPQLVSERGWEALYEEKKNHYQEFLKQGSLELMPGVDLFLRLVQEAKVPHCVVTNSTKEQVECIKRSLPILQELPLWITREDYAHPKPAPDGYQKGVELLKSSGKMIGFEDSLRGVYSLQRAGISPILICSPDHPQMAEVDKDKLPHFATFNQLIAFLRAHKEITF